MDKILKIDIFRKLPRDLTEPTCFGALVSFVCTVFLAILTVSEVKAYMSESLSTETVVQTSHALDEIRVNIDIELPKIPCDVIGLDINDTSG